MLENMQIFSENISQEDDSSSEEADIDYSEDDDSQAAVQECDSDYTCSSDSSEISGPLVVEILGLELLLDQTHRPTEHRSIISFEVDSLVLARKRLAKNRLEAKENKKPSRRRLGDEVKGFFGEVDSLILARKRVPHIIHDREAMKRHKRRLGGTFGEVDSLILARKRIPHMLHDREAMKGRIHTRLHTRQARKLSNTIQDKVDADASSDIEIDLLCGEVDSLVLTRKRLGKSAASHSRNSEEHIPEKAERTEKVTKESNPTQIGSSKGFKAHTHEMKKNHDLLAIARHNSGGSNCAA